MTDLIERMKEALEGYHKDHRAFGAEIARDGLGLSACTLLPETIEEIKRLRKQITAMALDNMASADQAAENNTRAEAAEAKLAVAVAELDRLNFDWECITGRQIKGEGMSDGCIIATCGCRVNEVYDLVTVRLEEMTREGVWGVSYNEFCPSCAEKASKWDGFLPDDDAASAFMGDTLAEIKGEK